MSLISVSADSEGNLCSVFVDHTPGFPLGKPNLKEKNIFSSDLIVVSFPWSQQTECTVKWSARYRSIGYPGNAAGNLLRSCILP